jgi:Ca-activated chloride channel homolog
MNSLYPSAIPTGLRPAACPTARLFRAGVTVALSVLVTSAFASPGSALREYKAGKYDQAYKDYETLLQRKGDDPRLHFNAGTAAYQNKQFDEASKQFDQALNSPDLNLQGLAYYNRGNTLFRMGEQDPDSSKRTETWKKSLQDFQSSLKLYPQDGDAKANEEFVKKKLEELKQQQQQSDKSDQKKDQDQDQKNQQNQQNQQPKQDQNKDQKQDKQQQQQQQQQQQSQQDKSGQKQDAQQQAAQQQEAQKQQAQKSEEQKQKQAKAAAAQGKEGDEKDQQKEMASAAGQMTPQQAQQLLDAQKGDEMLLPPNPKGKPADRNRPFKDW